MSVREGERRSAFTSGASRIRCRRPLPASIAGSPGVAHYCIDLSRSQAYYTLRSVRASHWRPWKEATDRPRRPRCAP